MIKLYHLLIGVLLATTVHAQPDTTRKNRQFGLKLHYSLSASDQVVPATGRVPLGAELTYSWAGLNQRTWQQCHCFANVGVYAAFYTFRNPLTLGQTAGAGLFFEPLINPRRRLYFSTRFSAGLTYLNRVYDPVTNPTNQHFSLPVSAMIGLSLTTYYKLTDRVHLSLSGFYNHISNSGIRQPNQGLNLPSLTTGIVYIPHPVPYPATQRWRTAQTRQRWVARGLLMGSVRVLDGTPSAEDKALPMFGLNLIAGYRLRPAHILSGGIELVDDRYFKEQIKQWQYEDQNHYQGSLLGGYEFWQGRYSFTAHMAWDALRPLRYKPATYQKYGLLYRFDSGFTLGFNVKAYLDTTKGFQAVGGFTF